MLVNGCILLNLVLRPVLWNTLNTLLGGFLVLNLLQAKTLHCPFYKADPILIVCIYVCINVMTDLYRTVRPTTALVTNCLTYSNFT